MLIKFHKYFHKVTRIPTKFNNNENHKLSLSSFIAFGMNVYSFHTFPTAYRNNMLIGYKNVI